MRFKPTDPVTPEMIAERFAEITNMDDAVHFNSAMEEVMTMFKHLI